MTIISMITLSALALVCLSHMTISHAQKQQHQQKSFVPIRMRYSSRRR